MENKINQLFKEKKSNILSIYITAGFPELNDTVKNIRTLQELEVDLIEIGLPYSDPLADGPVIQEANKVAIINNMNLHLLFEQLYFSKEEIKIPIILMGYLNVIMQFGIELFYKRCAECNVSGVIIPDLPIEEYNSNHKYYAELNNVKNIFLITPKTSIERIKLIDSISDPFIYVVSSNSITGNTLSSFEELRSFYNQLNALQLKNKTLIGFGISNSSQYENACQLANGAIIGSAFISSIVNAQPAKNFIHNIRKLKSIAL